MLACGWTSTPPCSRQTWQCTPRRCGRATGPTACRHSMRTGGRQGQLLAATACERPTACRHSMRAARPAALQAHDRDAAGVRAHGSVVAVSSCLKAGGAGLPLQVAEVQHWLEAYQAYRQHRPSQVLILTGGPRVAGPTLRRPVATEISTPGRPGKSWVVMASHTTPDHNLVHTLGASPTPADPASCRQQARQLQPSTGGHPTPAAWHLPPAACRAARRGQERHAACPGSSPGV